ncbi:MAG: 30S ribosomal protein S20 [Bacteroidales bacterium]|nr:30S ribosomal protein S20 [Bacteroidales bacterium]
MANHKSALKRIRQNEARKEQNHYHKKTMRNAVKKFRNETEKATATEGFPKLASIIDKLAKKRLIHKNKAANLKSKLAKQLNAMA